MTSSRPQVFPPLLRRGPSTLCVVLAAALALPASAQEFGLDLTDSTQSAPAPKPKRRPKRKPRVEPPPAPSPEDSPAVSIEPSDGQFGLDLSAPSSPDLRPTLVVLGVGIKPAAEGASPSEADGALARRTASTLLAEAGKEGRFRIITPDEARERLGDGYEAALQCSEASCFEQALEMLDAERALGAQVMVGGGQEVSVRLNGFSRGKGEVETTDVGSGGPPRPAFQQAIAADAQRLLGSLSTLLAQLKLTTNVPDATVNLGERTLGAGSLEAQVSAGRHTLRLIAAGHAPFERDITLEPGQTLEVEANLTTAVAKVPDYVDPDLEAATGGTKRSGPALTFRPGWVVALGGVVVAAVGVGFGASAQAVASRATDANGDGVLDVTRQEMLAAQGNATLANVLVGTGGAMVVGGGLWFLLAPAPRAPAVALGGGGGVGLQAVAGGTF